MNNKNLRFLYFSLLSVVLLIVLNTIIFVVYYCFCMDLNSVNSLSDTCWKSSDGNITFTISNEDDSNYTYHHMATQLFSYSDVKKIGGEIDGEIFTGNINLNSYTIDMYSANGQKLLCGYMYHPKDCMIISVNYADNKQYLNSEIELRQS